MEGQFTPFSIDNTNEIQRLELALQSAGIGTWELDSDTNFIKVCTRTKALFGISGENVISLETLLGFVHPDDRFRNLEPCRMQMALKDGFFARGKNILMPLIIHQNCWGALSI
jgi:PAS domain-containing protein